ncbi:NUDIX hydrolase [Myxococcota bacterium]|nr:NUDIX hydrolase [Myxococcota bacterium]MBU1382732.1 NUDIX hydrolase [Myxococcota bacterium]MBU1498290.1 NUDIX hydrolase [Myxococcota bacterium]
MKKIVENVLWEGKWLRAVDKVFEKDDGEIIHWETVERQGSSRSVVIIAKMIPSGRFVFIKQYRQTVENWVVGFPAGLLDENLTPEDQAQKELFEETGYTGKVVKVSPLLRFSTGTNASWMNLVNMEIDESSEENLHPVQHLEKAEEISVHLKTRNEAQDFILNEMNAGTQVGSGVWYLFGNVLE